MNYKDIYLKVYGDHRGKLVVIETLKNIPFEIKNITYLKNLKNKNFDKSSYKDSEQIIICVKGHCQVSLKDTNGMIPISLQSPDHGLLINSMDDIEIEKCSDNCGLLIVGSGNILSEN